MEGGLSYSSALFVQGMCHLTKSQIIMYNHVKVEAPTRNVSTSKPSRKKNEVELLSEGNAKK